MRLILASLLICFLAAHAEEATPVAVKIVQRAPIQTLGPDGAMTKVSMSTPGASMTFVRMEGDQVVLKDTDGTSYMIGVSATDYTPPPAAPAAPSPTAPKQPVTTLAAPSPTTATPTASSPPAPSTPSSPEQDEMVKKINALIGIPFFTGNNFWKSSLDDVEAKFAHFSANTTGDDTLYVASPPFGDKTITLFGCSVWGLAVDGKKNKPTYITILFRNMVDSPEVKDRTRPSPDEIRQINETVSQKIVQDQQSICDALTSLFGEPSIREIKNNEENRREERRWDWQDVSFILNFRPGAYIFMEIMAKEEADRVKASTPLSRDGLAEALAKNVVTNSTGDVTLKDIPEGAEFALAGGTDLEEWQRYLRYMQVPSDIYIVGVMCAHSFGSNGSNWNMSSAFPSMNDYLSPYECHLERIGNKLTIDQIADFIDRGLPMVWTGFFWGEDETNAIAHGEARRKDFDPRTYAERLDKEDTDRSSIKDTPQPRNTESGAWVVIGYNKATQEIALKGPSSGGVSPTLWVSMRTVNRLAPYGFRYVSCGDRTKDFTIPPSYRSEN